MLSVFVSYHFGQGEVFISRVCHFLRKQGIRTYFHDQSPIVHGVGGGWRVQIIGQLQTASALLFFCGTELGVEQKGEFDEARRLGKPIILVEMMDCQASVDIRDAAQKIIFQESMRDSPGDPALFCARKCCEAVNQPWVPEDDIPDGYPFDYEKAIIDAYINDRIDINLLSQGCPDEWPPVERKPAEIENPVSETDIGKYRDLDAKGDVKQSDPTVSVAAISDFSPEELGKRGMVLSLAGPRSMLHFNSGDGAYPFKVAVLVSGGIAPGTNAVISAICQRHDLYARKGGYDVHVLGYSDGFKGLICDVAPKHLRSHVLEGTFDRGGSIIGTSREPGFIDDDREERDHTLRKAVGKLVGDGVRILYVIGGDGTMRAAHVLWNGIKEAGLDISVSAIPKTMDNDVLWGWQTLGFESAVEKANEIIHQLHVEAESNPRLGVLQLFGSDSGNVVTHAALASGLCDLFLIPEIPFTMRRIWKVIAGKTRRKAEENFKRGYGPYRSHGLILTAEAAVPVDAKWYLNWADAGLTNDEKKEVEDYLHLEYWDHPPFEVPDTSKRKIRKYLGVDQEEKYTNVEPLADEERACIREYARIVRTKGQTPDGLRSAGLKLVSRVLQRFFQTNSDRLPGKYWRGFRVFTNEPRHAIRAVSPTSSDILFGHRLGTLAVDGAMAGYTDFMISQWLTEYVMVPLRLVVLGRKRLPEKGIFYRSALSSTGQPADLM
jgi:6-phosphofructokinase